MNVTNKTKLKYVCQECGAESFKWIGKCPACNSWNSYQQEIEIKNANPRSDMFYGEKKSSTPTPVAQIPMEDHNRIPTGIQEFDRLLGGGLVPDSLILIGGEPGIGKSTILLQVGNQLAKNYKKVLYVTGEESPSQIKGRAQRLGVMEENLLILSEVNLLAICEQIKKIKPDVVIIDSIQIIFKPEIPSSPGTVVQVRECSNDLMMLAKTEHIAIFVVGHVTKDGNIAGPKVLEHIVDTVLYFEGDRHHAFRILRAVKNRFGSTNEIAIFEMHNNGLAEVKNPSEIFLSQETLDVPGTVIVPTIEGTRPLFIELQALLSASYNVGMPRRVSTFIDHNRIALLIAIFEKNLGIGLGQHDVFINLVGGIKVTEPALDLGVILAMHSSYRNYVIKKGTIVFGEVGLGGEVRGVSHADKRIKEAIRLGYQKCILPGKNLKNLGIKKDEIELIGINSIQEALDAL